MMDLKIFEQAIGIARKHKVKTFTLNYKGDSMIVDLEEEPIEIPESAYAPEGDTMMTEQQFNEADDYLITNPTTMR